MKVLVSIGGWTYSSSFHPIVVSPQLRSKFVASAVRLLEDHGLDGLDVDYEYPSNEAQARGYVDLLRELRAALDQHAQKKGANYRFLLTVRPASLRVDRVVSARRPSDCRTVWSRQLQEALYPRDGPVLGFLELDGIRLW